MRARHAAVRLGEAAAASARRLSLAPEVYLRDRRGTAATLRAIDAAAGGGFYDVPAEAAEDADAAAEALGGDELVVDVQTHYVRLGRTRSAGARGVLGFIRDVAPERFRHLDPETSLSLAEYLRCVFVESETAVAVLTAAPGDDASNILPNPDIAATRALVDRVDGGRLRHHAIVHPNRPEEREAVDAIAARFRPDGVKVYTLYGGDPAGRTGRAWMLDDEETGLPFLARVRSAGLRVVCAHKGLSGLSPTGSPRDVGPAAAAFPELDFLVYHAGYELPTGEGDAEGAFPEDVPPPALRGTDRLVASLREAGIPAGGNVYAELGSTWYALIRRPLEAAHVIGKLLLAVGPDRVLWGTDSVWYGPCQPLIDAFRAFRIPERLCERHGYPPLTRALKARILGLNAARVYGLDPAAARRAAAADDLGWIGEALREARARGLVADG